MHWRMAVHHIAPHPHIPTKLSHVGRAAHIESHRPERKRTAGTARHLDDVGPRRPPFHTLHRFRPCRLRPSVIQLWISPWCRDWIDADLLIEIYGATPRNRSVAEHRVIAYCVRHLRCEWWRSIIANCPQSTECTVAQGMHDRSVARTPRIQSWTPLRPARD